MNRFARLKEIGNQFSLVEKKWNPLLLSKQGEFISGVRAKSPIFLRNILSVPAEKFLRSSNAVDARQIRSVEMRDGMVARSPRDAQMSRLCGRVVVPDTRRKWASGRRGGGGGCRRRRLHTRRPVQTSSEGADTHCDHMFPTKEKNNSVRCTMCAHSGEIGPLCRAREGNSRIFTAVYTVALESPANVYSWRDIFEKLWLETHIGREANFASLRI